MERSAWKRALVDRLLEGGYDVALVFGEASYVRHARAALRRYGPGVRKARRVASAAGGPRLFDHYRQRGLACYRVGDLNGRRAERLLRRLRPDLLLLLGTGIVRPNILAVPRTGAVHCHQGYLPDYRGVHTIEWSIYEGRDVYITTHFVDAGIDTGAILYRKRISLAGLSDVAQVRERCQWEAVALLAQTIDDLRDGTIRPVPQAAAAGRQYFSMHPFFLDAVHRRLRTQTAGTP